MPAHGSSGLLYCLGTLRTYSCSCGQAAIKDEGKEHTEIYMFTVEELLSKRNQRDAFAHFETKKDGCGPDGMRLSE